MCWNRDLWIKGHFQRSTIFVLMAVLGSQNITKVVIDIFKQYPPDFYRPILLLESTCPFVVWFWKMPISPKCGISSTMQVCRFNLCIALLEYEWWGLIIERSSPILTWARLKDQRFNLSISVKGCVERWWELFKLADSCIVVLDPDFAQLLVHY